MSTKHTHPAFPPQIALDQFQRPVAPIPGMSMLDYFTLHLYSQKVGLTFHEAITEAHNLLEALSNYQSENTLQTLKIVSNEQ